MTEINRIFTAVTRWINKLNNIWIATINETYSSIASKGLRLTFILKKRKGVLWESNSKNPSQYFRNNFLILLKGKSWRVLLGPILIEQIPDKSVQRFKILKLPTLNKRSKLTLLHGIPIMTTDFSHIFTINSLICLMFLKIK